VSGGSYNYAYHRVPELIQDALDMLTGHGEEQGIARRLWELAPGSRAAIDAAAGAALLQGALEDFNGLQDVLHAVEWLDSADYGEDQVAAAVAEYRAAS
jgi:hypothetical protein